MELRDALSQIDVIRRHMVRGTVFRGYTSLSIGVVGCLAVCAALFQSHWVPDPRQDARSYLVYWIGIATLASVIVAVGMWRQQSQQSSLARESSWQALEQLLPSLGIGAILTFSIYRWAPEVLWMLPGVWSLVFSLGVFASCSLLPKRTYFVGAYYVLAGLGCLMWGQGSHALSPWLMGITFGGGQLFGAAALFFALERDDVAEE